MTEGLRCAHLPVPDRDNCPLDNAADLIVLGKRGNHADFSKGHLGSNLERVIRSCRHPVLVASSEVWPMECFVMAYDGGPSANKAVDYLVTQPLLKGLHCHLLCVGKSGSKHESSLREAGRCGLRGRG